jgi:hypothetical protein
MARRASRRWRDWRVDESGRSIRSTTEREATAKSKRKSKPKRAKKGPMPSQWWEAFAPKGCVCDECGEAVPPGELTAYRHHPRRSVCVGCAKQIGIAERCKPSRKVREARRKG